MIAHLQEIFIWQITFSDCKTFALIIAATPSSFFAGSLIGELSDNQIRFGDLQESCCGMAGAKIMSLSCLYAFLIVGKFLLFYVL